MAESTPQPLDLTGKNALIRADMHGAGWQMARTLGQAGARLMISGGAADTLEKATAKLQALGIDARWCVADGLQAEGMEQLVSETLQRMGDIDILVNQAGLAGDAQSGEQEVQQGLQSLQVLAQAVVARSMLGRSGGCIIHLASCAAQAGIPADRAGLFDMRMAQALVQITQAQARAWAHGQIRVNALCCATASEWPGTATLAMPCKLPPGAAELMQQWGGTEAMAGATRLLVSEAGLSITGQCLAVQGGVSA